MKFKFNGKALWINFEKYIQITAQGQRHALKRTIENLILIIFDRCKFLGLHERATFSESSTVHCMVLCTDVHMVAHCALGLPHCVPLGWLVSTDSSPSPDSAGRARTTVLLAQPHYAEYKHQSVWQEKTGGKIHHPSTHLDPLTQL